MKLLREAPIKQATGWMAFAVMVAIFWQVGTGWIQAQQRCDLGGYNKITAAQDIIAFERRSFSWTGLVLEGYKFRINQCFDLSAWRE